MQNSLRFQTEVETEVQLLKQRISVKDKVEQFQKFNTQKDIQQFTQKIQAQQKQKEASRPATKEQDLKRGKDTKPAQQPLNLLQNQEHKKKTILLNFDDTNIQLSQTSQQEVISQKQSQQPQEDEISSDIELPNLNIKRETFQQKMEQLRNQCLMEKEDKIHAAKLQEKEEQKQLLLVKKQDKKYQMCNQLLEELLEQVVGTNETVKYKQQYRSLKQQIYDDIYEVTNGSAYSDYKQKQEQNYKQGAVILNSEQVFEIQNKQENIQKYVHIPILQAKPFKNEENVNINLIISQTKLIQEDLVSQFGDFRIQYFNINQFDQELLNSYKQEITNISDKLKVIQKDKTKNPQNTKIKIQDKFAILPSQGDLEKFVKSVTNESLVYGRINYLIQRQCNYQSLNISNFLLDIDYGDRIQSAQQEVDETADNKGKKLDKTALDKIVQKQLEEFNKPNQPLSEEQKLYNIVIVLDNVKQLKQVQEVEQALQFIIYLKNKLDAKKQFEDVNVKNSLETTVKSKYVSISISVFQNVYYFQKPNQLKLEKKPDPNQKQVKQQKSEVDQNDQIADQMFKQLEKNEADQNSGFTAQNLNLLNDYSVLNIQDDFVAQLQNMYKPVESILKLLNSYQSNEIQFQINLENITLNVGLNQLLDNLFNICIEQLCNVVKIDEENINLKIEQLNKLFNKKELQKLIQQIQDQIQEQLKQITFDSIYQINNYHRLLALRGIRYRMDGAQHIIGNLKHLILEMRETLQEDQLQDEKLATKNKKTQNIIKSLKSTINDAYQTELENITHMFREQLEMDLINISEEYSRFQSIHKHVQLIDIKDMDLIQRKKDKLKRFLTKYYNKYQLNIIIEGATDCEQQIHYQKQLSREILKSYVQLINYEAIPQILCYKLSNQLHCIDNIDEKEDQPSFEFNQNVSVNLIFENQQIDFDDVEAVINGILEYKQQFAKIVQFTINFENEFKEIQPELSKQHINSTNHIQQLLSSTYQLILRSCNSKDNKNNSQLLFKDLENYQNLLENELSMLKEIYSNLDNDLALKQLDEDQANNDYNNLLNSENIIQFKQTQSIEEINQLVDQLLKNNKINLEQKQIILEKLQLNPISTSQQLQQQFCIQYQQIDQIPDTSKNAKKGATISQITNYYYYCEYINLLQEAIPIIDVTEVKKVVQQFIKTQLYTNVSSVSNQSSTKLTLSKPAQLDKKAQELLLEQQRKQLEEQLKIDNELIDLCKQMEYEKLEDLLINSKTVFFKGYSIEFNKIFMEKYLSLFTTVKVKKVNLKYYIFFILVLLCKFTNIESLKQLLFELLGVNDEQSKVEQAAKLTKIWSYMHFIIAGQFIDDSQKQGNGVNLTNLWTGGQVNLEAIQSIQQQQEEVVEEPTSRKGQRVKK